MMKLRRRSISLTALVLAGLLIPAAQADEKKLPFWKATKDNQVIYLLGTIDYVSNNSKIFPLPFEIERAIGESKKIAVQTSDWPRKLLETNSALTDCGEGEKLDKHLNSQTKADLDRYLEWAGERFELYHDWKPWFVSATIDQSAVKRDGFKDSEFDAYLAKNSRHLGKVMQELEPADVRVKALSSLSADDQNKLLRASLLRLMKPAADEKKLEEAWSGGDPQQMEQASISSLQSETDLRNTVQKVIDDSNKAIVNEVKALPTDGAPGFAALDVSRIVGKQGILAMLEKDGFKVEQIGQGASPILSTVTSTTPDVVATTRDIMAKGAPLLLNRPRLSKFTFPEGRFSIMLPERPSTEYTTGMGLRQVSYTCAEVHGAYKVTYYMLPGRVYDSRIDALLDKISGSMVADLGGVELRRYAINVQGNKGRQLEVGKFKDRPDKHARVRLIIAGNYVYTVVSIGKKAWLDAPITAQVMDSLLLITEENPYDRTGYHSNADSRMESDRRDAERREWEQRSRSRSSFSRGSKWGTGR